MQAARNPGIKKSRSFGIPELRIHIFIQCSFGLKPGVFGQWFCRRYPVRRTPRLVCFLYQRIVQAYAATHMFFVTNCLGVDYRSHRRSAEIQWKLAVAEVSGDQRRTAEVSAGPPEVQRRSISQKSCKFRYCSGMEPKKSCKCVFLLFVAPTQARSQKNRTSACFQRFQTLSTKNMQKS